MASVTSFSWVPMRPRAPGSSPPWPASMAMVISRSTSGGFEACLPRLAAPLLAASCGGALARLTAHALRPAAAGPSPPRGCIGSTRGGRGHQGPLLLELRNQRQQRIHRSRRVDVQHQAVRILAHRPQRERLRIDLGLQVQNQAGDAGSVASHPRFADERVVCPESGWGAPRARRPGSTSSRSSTTRSGSLMVNKRVFDRLGRLDGDAGVLRPGPHAHGGDRGRGQGDGREQAQQEQDPQRPATTRAAPLPLRRASGFSRSVAPGTACPRRCLLRAARADRLSACSRRMRRSAAGSCPAAFSGHSTRQTAPAPKASRKPASIHSRGSSKR